MFQIIRDYILKWVAERVLADLLAGDLTDADKASINEVLEATFNTPA